MSLKARRFCGVTVFRSAHGEGFAHVNHFFADFHLRSERSRAFMRFCVPSDRRGDLQFETRVRQEQLGLPMRDAIEASRGGVGDLQHEFGRSLVTFAC
jgi:hypothetical protein